MQFKLINLIKFMLIIMPIVDTVNGIFLGESVSGLNPGQIYRLILMLFLLISLVNEHSILRIDLGVFIFAIFLMGVKFLLDINMDINEIGVMLKLFLPIFIISTSIAHFKTNMNNGLKFIRDVLNKLSILTPLTIIIPFFLGIGNATYDGHAGFKGFYYATNEISFLIDVLLIFLVLEFSRRILWLIKFFLCIIAGFLIGTKSVLLTGVICVLVSFMKVLYANKMSQKHKLCIILIPLVMISIFLNDIYEQFIPIWNRWEYGFSKNEAEGIVFLLTSGRIIRPELAWEAFSASNLETVLFGWGLTSDLSASNYCEMDFLDLLFSTGIICFFIVVMYYTRLVIKPLYNKKSLVIIYLWIFILIGFGGHVIYAGLGGMALGILLLYLYFYNNILHMHKNKVYKEACNEEI